MATSNKKKRLDISDEENEDQLKINKDFSERYERYRSKEVLQHLKDKYGDQIWQSEEEESEEQNDEESDSEGSSDESSELDETELFDEKFLRVLGALKTKDETIYEKDAVFYSKDDVVDLDQKREQRKQAKLAAKRKAGTVERMDLNDYHKKLIKEKKGVTAEDEEMENQQEQPNINLGYYEELNQIKKDLLKAADDGEGEDDLIVGKKVIEYSDNEEERKKKDVKTILETKSKEDKYIKKLNKYWKKEDLNSNEKFLRDFIVNKTYLSGSSDEEDGVESKEHQSNKVKKIIEEEEDRSEDEYDSDDSTHRKLVKTYESTRFHHEEPDADKIKRFPRQIESIRDIALKKKRSDKRTEVKERKKQQKEAELRKLRELKRDEIRHKINLLEKTTGNKIASKLKEIDIDMLVDDTDFDAEKYDQKMAELFNDEYYGITEEDNSEKPKFEYDSDIDDDKFYDEFDQGLVADGEDYKGEIVNFDNEQEDGDDIEEFNEEELNNDQEAGGRLSKKKRQRLKKRAKEEQKKKEKLLKNKNFGIFEDVIGGQGVRFKYRKTTALDFGLTDEEILLADEKELNKWTSLKKIQQYEDDPNDIEKYARKRQNLRLKKKILKSLYASSDEEDVQQDAKYRTNDDQKIAEHNDEDINEDINEDQSNEQNGEDDLSKKRKKKNRKKKKNKKQKLIEQES